MFIVHRRHARTALLGELLKTCFAPPPGPPGNRWRRSSATPPSQAFGGTPQGLAGHRAFFFASRTEEGKRRSAPLAAYVWALVQLHPSQKPPPRPAGGSHCLGYHMGQGRGHRKGQFSVRVLLGSPSALRTKKPRTGGAPVGGAETRSPQTRFLLSAITPTTPGSGPFPRKGPEGGGRAPW